MFSNSEIAEVLVRAAEIYVVAGFIFGVMFVWRGAIRVDPTVRGSSARFRLLILPGVIALWPVLLGQWHRARTRGET